MLFASPVPKLLGSKNNADADVAMPNLGAPELDRHVSRKFRIRAQPLLLASHHDMSSTSS